MPTQTSADSNIQQAVPFFWVHDLEASVRFYVDGLGFQVRKQWSSHGKLRWCWPTEAPLPRPNISRMGYNPANFAYEIGTGPWSAGYSVSYAVSFLDETSETESALSKWWGPKTDPKKLYGGFGLIRIPVDPAGRATARRIWRKFAGRPAQMIHQIPDNTTTEFQDGVL